ncbi:hypothetical protein LINGRAHAP2_LOCUS8064 [Linum grandiflorum]
MFGVPSSPVQLFSPRPSVVFINKSKVSTVMVTLLVLCVPLLLVIVSTQFITIIIHTSLCTFVSYYKTK